MEKIGGEKGYFVFYTVQTKQFNLQERVKVFKAETKDSKISFVDHTADFTTLDLDILKESSDKLYFVQKGNTVTFKRDGLNVVINEEEYEREKSLAKKYFNTKRYKRNSIKL